MDPQKPYEAKLAWAIWQALEKLSSLLWDRYKKDFLSLATEKDNPYRESPPSDTAEEDYDWESTPSDTEQFHRPPPKHPASSES
jgi:hypothetical protein